MNWLSWENPVAIWWMFLVSVSAINIAAWFWTRYYLAFEAHSKIVVWLSGAYVFGCAFRSLLPRADVQRICLFDTWWSSVLVGRTVATIAEVSFVAQWALVLLAIAPQINSLAYSALIKKVGLLVVPIILVAECFSWFAVTSTNYLGNTIEESLWAVTYSLLTIALIIIWKFSRGPLRFASGIAIVGSLLYVAFMVSVDVPMYFQRWQSDLAVSKQFFGLWDGFHDLNTRWIVTHDIHNWKDEIPWMSLYFSCAVWTSLALCYVRPSNILDSNNTCRKIQHL